MIPGSDSAPDSKREVVEKMISAFSLKVPCKYEKGISSVGKNGASCQLKSILGARDPGRKISLSTSQKSFFKELCGINDLYL